MLIQTMTRDFTKVHIAKSEVRRRLNEFKDEAIQEGYNRGRIKTMEQHGDANILARQAERKELIEGIEGRKKIKARLGESPAEIIIWNAACDDILNYIKGRE